MYQSFAKTFKTEKELKDYVRQLEFEQFTGWDDYWELRERNLMEYLSTAS